MNLPFKVAKMSLRQLRTELRKFKTTLLELSMERSVSEDDLAKIVESTSNKENLLEMIILMYSNSKSDIQSVKSFQIKTLIELVDKLETSIVEYSAETGVLDNKIANVYKELNSRLDLVDEKVDHIITSKFLNTWYGKILFGLLTGLIVVTLFFTLHKLDSESAKFSSGIFNNLFNKTMEIGTGAK